MFSKQLSALAVAAALGIGTAAAQSPYTFESRMDMRIDGKTWLSTITTPLDEANREETYKVYTHIYDFTGDHPITKGAGGKYTHHRGLFIGWKDTIVNGEDYDTWHMPNSTQKHVSWDALEAGADAGKQVEQIDWLNDKGAPVIHEVRTIATRAGDNGMRIIDFKSDLASMAGAIELKGDSHHAGMQVRLADEVSEHEDSTQYILPQGAEERENDEVFGGWWVMCSAVVKEKRYWLIHMTPPDHPTGMPVYSIRRYARFGSFFETTLQEGSPLMLNFRIVVSESEITADQAQALYDAYASEAR